MLKISINIIITILYSLCNDENQKWLSNNSTEQHLYEKRKIGHIMSYIYMWRKSEQREGSGGNRLWAGKGRESRWTRKKDIKVMQKLWLAIQPACSWGIIMSRHVHAEGFVARFHRYLSLKYQNDTISFNFYVKLSIRNWSCVASSNLAAMKERMAIWASLFGYISIGEQCIQYCSHRNTKFKPHNSWCSLCGLFSIALFFISKIRFPVMKLLYHIRSYHRTSWYAFTFPFLSCHKRFICWVGSKDVGSQLDIVWFCARELGCIWTFCHFDYYPIENPHCEPNACTVHVLHPFNFMCFSLSFSLPAHKLCLAPRDRLTIIRIFVMFNAA